MRESRDLRLVLSGEFLTGLGTQAALVALPYQVYTQRSALLVGLLGVVELGPLVAASLLGGAIADRIDRRRLLLVGQFAEMVFVAGLAAIALSGPPTVVLVFVLGGPAGRGRRRRNVARSAMVPGLAGPERLRSALSLNFGLTRSPRSSARAPAAC